MIKNLIKLILLTCFTISIVSCNDNSDLPFGEPNIFSSHTPYATEPPLSINDTEYSFTFIKLYKNGRYSKEYSWEKYINENFGISINLEPLDYEADIAVIPDAGLIYVESIQQLNFLIEHGKLMKLDSFNLEEIFNDYELSSYSNYGSYYGIPVSNFLEYYSRIYLTDKIDQTLITKIKSVNDFYEVMLPLSQERASNDKFIAIGLYINNAHIQLYDFLRAFGCYFGTQNQNLGCAIAFNPNLGSYEDCVYSENIREYIEYIVNLKAHGILEITDINYNHHLDTDYPYISYWGHVSSSLKEENSVPSFNYLTGINDKNLYEAVNYPTSFGILKKTEKPEEYIKLVTENTADNDNLYLSFFFGIEGEDYSFHGDYLVNYDAIGERVGITTYNNTPMYFTKKTTFTNDEIFYMKDAAEVKRAEFDIYIENLDYSVIYSLPYLYSEENLLQQAFMRKEQPLDFNQIVLNKVLMGEVSIEDAIAEYKVLFKKRGLDENIHNLNLLIGTGTNYDY